MEDQRVVHREGPRHTQQDVGDGVAGEGAVEAEIADQLGDVEDQRAHVEPLAAEFQQMIPAQDAGGDSRVESFGLLELRSGNITAKGGVPAGTYRGQAAAELLVDWWSGDTQQIGRAGAPGVGWLQVVAAPS